ncbi:MAG: ATP-binding protein, partial [Clostridiales bacterium]|nr:ATP-binding protein [Clostridiales bacterium]
TRYNSGKPFIVTTNLTIEEIKKPTETSDLRIYDRILERCTPIEVNEQSRRRIKAADDYHKAQMMLGLI